MDKSSSTPLKTIIKILPLVTLLSPSIPSMVKGINAPLTMVGIERDSSDTKVKILIMVFKGVEELLSMTVHCRDLVPIHPGQITRPVGTQPVGSHEEWTSLLREMDRIQFLIKLYTSIYGATFAEKLAHAYRSSTDKQAQSCANYMQIQIWYKCMYT